MLPGAFEFQGPESSLVLRTRNGVEYKLQEDMQALHLPLNERWSVRTRLHILH
jgi:hypothetical protein